MKSNVKQSNRKAAFTIVELLTVMSIIVILIGLLVPALSKVKQFARDVKQKAQFHSIEAALELFNSQFDSYPESLYSDDTGPSGYCGAEKLCEAMMGQDMLGYHPDSTFRSDGTDGFGHTLYYNPSTTSARKGPFLPLENANAYPLGHIYDTLGPFDPCDYVLCDVYKRVVSNKSGMRIGMPILYYKANTINNLHVPDDPDNPRNIYNFSDNEPLLMLGMPWEAGRIHKLLQDPDASPAEPRGKRFYWNIRNDKINISRPYRADSFILISAGWDGEYGTSDDICNFDWKYVDTLP